MYSMLDIFEVFAQVVEVVEGRSKGELLSFIPKYATKPSMRHSLPLFGPHVTKYSVF